MPERLTTPRTQFDVAQNDGRLPVTDTLNDIRKTIADENDRNQEPVKRNGVTEEIDRIATNDKRIGDGNELMYSVLESLAAENPYFDRVLHRCRDLNYQFTLLDGTTPEFYRMYLAFGSSGIEPNPYKKTVSVDMDVVRQSVRPDGSVTLGGALMTSLAEKGVHLALDDITTKNEVAKLKELFTPKNQAESLSTMALRPGVKAPYTEYEKQFHAEVCTRMTAQVVKMLFERALSSGGPLPSDLPGIDMNSHDWHPIKQKTLNSVSDMFFPQLKAADAATTFCTLKWLNTWAASGAIEDEVLRNLRELRVIGPTGTLSITAGPPGDHGHK